MTNKHLTSIAFSITDEVPFFGDYNRNNLDKKKAIFLTELSSTSGLNLSNNEKRTHMNQIIKSIYRCVYIKINYKMVIHFPTNGHGPSGFTFYISFSNKNSYKRQCLLKESFDRIFVHLSFFLTYQFKTGVHFTNAPMEMLSKELSKVLLSFLRFKRC